jgi:hypothetical protein
MCYRHNKSRQEKEFVLLFHHCDKISQKTILKRKGFLWFKVSEVSVHGQLTPLFLDLWQGRNVMAEGHVSW